MRIYPVDEQSMTLQEKRWLEDIYNRRRHKMTSRFIIVFFLFLVVSFDILWFGGVVNIFLALAAATLYSIFNYYQYIKPFREDLEAGMKYKLPFTVTEKKYYPVTSQYMLRVYGIGRPIEVDQETFENCKEGGEIFLYMALRSRYLLNRMDSFEIQG